MFQDRTDAGLKLAIRLSGFKDGKTVVLGIPRGGMVVAAKIAHPLNARLAVLIVRKIGVPGHEELAAGAVSVDEKPVWNPEALKIANLSPKNLEHLLKQKIQEVRERTEKYHSGPFPGLEGKTVILADDGIATGATFEAALQWLTAQKPGRIIAAVPCAPPDTADRLRKKVDGWVCLEESPLFSAVGHFYRDFREVTDETVRQLLKDGNR